MLDPISTSKIMDNKTPENSIKISIIMPVYKVEDYVATAIDSILDQRCSDGTAFSAWELIAVDDGSPDKSGAICDSYAEKDSRIRVIHQKNAGAPAARNRAIDEARGQYFMFLDSDDYCEPTMLSDMYELCEKNEAELAISGFFIETYYDLAKGLYRTDDYIPEPAVYKTAEDFRKNAYRLFDKNMLYTPWNKLYRADYIREHKLYFPKTFWDDFPFVLSVIRDIVCVAVTDRQYYHFLRARTESETQKYVPKMYKKREEEHQWMLELYRYWGISDEKSMEMIARRYIDRLIGCMENTVNKKSGLSFWQKRAEIKAMLGSAEVSKSLRLARPRSIYARLMYVPIRMKNVTLCHLEAAVISFVKTHSMKLFSRLKAGR